MSSSSSSASSSAVAPSHPSSSSDSYTRYDSESTRGKHESRDDYEDEPRSQYKISNLITLFNKNQITLTTIFTYQKRVILLQISQKGFMYFLYIPSKYDMYVDRALGIATYELMDDDEQEDNVDTLFYNKLPIENLRRVKTSKNKSLQRFLPLVSESPVKLMFLEEYFLSYITRHNDIDSLLLSSPFNSRKGYFYVIELEFFYKHINKMSDELSKFERALNEAVYDKLTVEISAARKAIKKAYKVISSLQPKEEKEGFLAAINKLQKYSNVEKHREKAYEVMTDFRMKNLNKMFEIENVTYTMKEFK